MRYDLAIMAKRRGLKRHLTTFAPILITSALANDLAAIARQIIAPWLNARMRISDLYARELDRTLHQDSINDLTSLFAELSRDVESLILDLTPALRDWAFRVEAWHRGKWSRTVLAGADVDVETMIGPIDATETIETFMARQTALIRDVSDEVRGRVADVVYRGLQQRVPTRKVGAEIAKATGLARRRANRIAADQATKLSAALDTQRQREAGLEIFRYHHSGKIHFRAWHKARDGKLYEIDSGKEVIFKNGKKTYGPDVIAPDDRPGIPPFCGCTTSAVLVIDGKVF